MEASIVIPTRNKASYLELTLESLVHQSFEPSQYEVIVVDDGSTDRTSAVVEHFRGRAWNFRCIEQVPAGRSAARNVGIRAARGKVVIFVDDDCLCNRNLVAAHVASHDETSNKVVIGWYQDVLSRIPLHRESLIHNVEGMLNRLGNIPTALSLEKAAAILPETLDIITTNDIIRNPEKIGLLELGGDMVYYTHFQHIAEGRCSCPWIVFWTRNVSVQRDTLLQAGLFDEDFQGWGEEDAELGYRLFRAGITFQTTMDAVIYHQLHPYHGMAVYKKEWLRNYMKFAEKYKTPEIYLRWQEVERVISLDQYECTVRQIEAGLLSQAELQAIKDRYDSFVAGHLPLDREPDTKLDKDLV